MWDHVTGGLARLAWPMLRTRAKQAFHDRGGDPDRWGERMGHDGSAGITGVIWVHAVSVGEMMSSLPLIDALLQEDQNAQVLLTTTTASAAALAADRLPSRAQHRYAPVDHPTAVRRFLDHWRPSRAIFLESEVWPNQIAALHRRNIPFALVSARLTEKAYGRWRKAGPLGRSIFARIPLILAQDAGTADRARALGAPLVKVEGSLKSTAMPLPVNDADLARMAAATQSRPLWIAASTHPGEERIVLDAHALVRREQPHALCILVPRHIERGADLATTFGPLPQRSNGALPTAETSVYLADSYGELGLWFSLSHVVFLGGSLLPNIGGHNPLEPAAFGCTILTGPHTANAKADFDALGGRVERVKDAAQMAAAVLDALKREREASTVDAKDTERAARIAQACLDLRH